MGDADDADGVRTQSRLPQGLCVELKWLDGDEFAHWTDPESFATSSATSASAASGRSSTPSTTARCPRGSTEMTSPRGAHVVDHVTHTWLPPPGLVVDDPDHAATEG